MHRDDHARLVTLAHVNRMAAALTPKHEAQSLATRTKSFAVAAGNFGVTQESQSA